MAFEDRFDQWQKEQDQIQFAAYFNGGAQMAGDYEGVGLGQNDVGIRRVLNGFIVKIGCQEVVFESQEKMLSELGRYFNNPQLVTKEYQDNAFKPAAQHRVH